MDGGRRDSKQGVRRKESEAIGVLLENAWRAYLVNISRFFRLVHSLGFAAFLLAHEADNLQLASVSQRPPTLCLHVRVPTTGDVLPLFSVLWRRPCGVRADTRSPERVC